MFSLRNAPPPAPPPPRHRPALWLQIPPFLLVAGVGPKPSLLPQKTGRAPYACHQGINKGFAVLCQVSEITCFFFFDS